MESRPTMTDEEMVKDYPRLKLEYSRLHADHRKVGRIKVISGVLMIFIKN